MKNKTWKNYLGAAALVTVLFAGSVSAYFTDQDEKVNTFTVGKVTIELEEPKWEKKPDDNGNKIPDEAERMTPNQTIIKDPQVKNTGNNDAFIYMTVEVPCRQIISVNNDGTRNPLAMRACRSLVRGTTGTRSSCPCLYRSWWRASHGWIISLSGKSICH